MTITITHNPWFNQYVATIDDGENDYQILAPTKTELLNKIKNQL
jgi:hypothetical protein